MADARDGSSAFGNPEGSTSEGGGFRVSSILLRFGRDGGRNGEERKEVQMLVFLRTFPLKRRKIGIAFKERSYVDVLTI